MPTNYESSFGAITFHLSKKEKQSITFGISIGVPKFGYPNDVRTNKESIALIDTGATCSAISRRFAENAHLRPIGRYKIHGFDKISIVPVYNVDIILPKGIAFKNLEVGQFDTIFNFDCIIGMDILRRGDMALTNAKDEMVFTFRIPPAETHIDFAEEEKNKQ